MFKISREINLGANNNLQLTKQILSHNTRLSNKENNFLPQKRTELVKKHFAV